MRREYRVSRFLLEMTEKVTIMLDSIHMGGCHHPRRRTLADYAHIGPNTECIEAMPKAEIHETLIISYPNPQD